MCHVCECNRGAIVVMDVVFSVCLVMRGGVGARVPEPRTPGNADSLLN